MGLRLNSGISHLLIPGFFLGILVSLACVSPTDYWWYLALGRFVEVTGEPISTNKFLYTIPTDIRFRDLPWMSEWILYMLNSTVGARGLKLISNFMAFGLWTWITYLGFRKSRNLLASIIWSSLVAFLVFPFFEIRTRLFAIPLFVLSWDFFLRDMSLDDGGIRWLWGLPIIAILWVNIHGSFLLIFIFPVVYTLCRQNLFQSHELIQTFALCLILFVAVGIHPLGFIDVYQYVWDILVESRDIFGLVTSWETPGFYGVYDIAIWSVSVLGLVIILSQAPEVEIDDLCFLILLVPLGLSSRRMFFWWAAGMVIIVPKYLGSHFCRTEDEQMNAGRKNTIIPYALIVVLGPLMFFIQPIGLLCSGKSKNLPLESKEGACSVLCKSNPVKLVRKLRDGYPGRLFHDQSLGGMLEYFLWEKNSAPFVFVDQRMRIIPLSVWHDYHAISSVQSSWQKLIERWNIGTLLLSKPNQKKLIEAIKGMSHWKVVGESQEHILIFRTDTKSSKPKNE